MTDYVALRAQLVFAADEYEQEMSLLRLRNVLETEENIDFDAIFAADLIGPLFDALNHENDTAKRISSCIAISLIAKKAPSAFYDRVTAVNGIERLIELLCDNSVILHYTAMEALNSLTKLSGHACDDMMESLILPRVVYCCAINPYQPQTKELAITLMYNLSDVRMQDYDFNKHLLFFTSAISQTANDKMASEAVAILTRMVATNERTLSMVMNSFIPARILNMLESSTTVRAANKFIFVVTKRSSTAVMYALGTHVCLEMAFDRAEEFDPSGSLGQSILRTIFKLYKKCRLHSLKMLEALASTSMRAKYMLSL
jgi:uncharacterized protein YkvS